MKWRVDNTRSLAITTTCVSCLEDDNEYMVYMSYIVAWARPLQIVSYLHQSCPRSYAKWWRNLAANLRLILPETSRTCTNRKTTPHTPKLKTPSLNTHTKEKRSTESGNKIAAKQLMLWSHKTQCKQDQGVKILAKLSPWFQYTFTESGKKNWP